MYKSDPSGGVRSDVKWDGLYECASWLIVIDIEIIVVQDVNFTAVNFNISVLYDGHWQIAWCSKVCE